ncbi:hypothetical protein ONS96_013724 [Cadophora gregata f. sp. sojae]|nr:hypothetical protein ONS96_013724 [Cadophora gregata f. sp. sojae]
MSSYSGTPSPKDKPDGTPDYEIIPRPELTFGVELEFGIALLPRGYIDPHPEDARKVYGILEPDRPEFKLADILCLGLHEPECIEDEIEEIAPIQLHIANTLRTQGVFMCSDVDGDKTDYDLGSSWLVKSDPSIKFPPLNYKFRDIEVVSPPFHFCKEALNEVKVVCQTLPTHYRLISNTTCSTHVHVGNGVQGFTVTHLRSLMALLWAFEPQLDTLHPQHRVGRTRYNGSLREHSKLGLKLRAKGMKLRDGLRRIFRTEEINEIVDILSVPSYQTQMPYTIAYSITNLMEKGRPDSYEDFVEAEQTKKKVEFRHHEGTFDAEAVTQWIRLCVRLVEFAEEVRPDMLQAWLEAYIDTNYNVTQILEAIKAPQAAEYYGKKLAERAARGPDTSERIVPNFHVDHLEESMINNYLRELGGCCQARDKRRYN